MPYNYKTEIQRYHKYIKELEPKLAKPKNKAYTTIVFSFLVVSLFGWYAIRPTIQTILLLQREIKDKTELSKKMEEKISALIEAQAYYQEIEPLLPAIDQALPTAPDAIPMIIQIRNLASLSATLITAIQLPSVPLTGQELSSTGKILPQSSSPATTSKQQVFDFAINIRGPYANLHAFIEGLTLMRRIITIDSITIVPSQSDTTSTASAEPNSKLLQLALKLKAYYLVK